MRTTNGMLFRCSVTELKDKVLGSIPHRVRSGVSKAEEGNEEEKAGRDFHVEKSRRLGTVLRMFLSSQHWTIRAKRSRGMRAGPAWATQQEPLREEEVGDG